MEKTLLIPGLKREKKKKRKEKQQQKEALWEIWGRKWLSAVVPPEGPVPACPPLLQLMAKPGRKYIFLMGYLLSFTIPHKHGFLSHSEDALLLL